jgi:hypothetical protein
MALHTGSPPTYFSDPISEPFLPFPELSPFKGQKQTMLKDESLQSIDKRLLRAWEFMGEFCSLINFAAKTSWKLSPDTITDTIASVMYPLLHMSLETGSADQAIRLGLLCFCNSVFLQWQGIRMPYDQFSLSYRESLLHPELAGKFSSQIMLWLLIIGAISVFSISEDQQLQDLLLQHIEVCQVKSWDEMQAIASSVLWISRLHDRPAKATVDSIVAP